jgi:hypothetical protein
MTSPNAWGEFAAVFIRTLAPHHEHEVAKAELRSLVPADASRPPAIASEPSARNPAPSASMCWTTRVPMQQRGSESIGALAAALAKAQIELINPEKSLVATIREEGRHGREQNLSLCTA